MAGTPIVNRTPSISFSDFFAPVTGLIQGFLNYDAQKKTNKTNQEINERNLEYNTYMTQKQWERDDNAHQREVADLKAAGLSPLAATNGANTSAAIEAPNPIAMQAPQLDVNSLINSLIQNKALNETKRHNLEQEGINKSELVLKGEELEQKAKQIDIEDKKLQQQIIYNYTYLSQIDKQIAEAKRHNNAEEELKKISYYNEQALKQIEYQTHGKFNYYIQKNYDLYVEELEAWQTRYDNYISEYIGATSIANSKSESENWNGQAGVGMPKVVQANGSIGEGSSESASFSTNYSQKYEYLNEKFSRTDPMPVFIWDL